MTVHVRDAPRRALVLGGGGVTGIAWEIGVLSGLLAAGVDLRGADVVIGTSAGAFVGVACASGYDIENLYREQLAANAAEASASASEDTVAAWLQAYTVGGADRELVGAEFGKLAKAQPEPVSVELRRGVVESRLVTRDWPATLRVTAIDADTGKLHVFDKLSGVELIDAVSASGAVPGVWPLQRIDGRNWVDGGMVSTANARLADGYGRVVVIAPMPWGFGQIPGAAEDVEALNGGGVAMLVAPDELSMSAIGPNPYDPDRRSPAALAGREQAQRLAHEVAATWGVAGAG